MTNPPGSFIWYELLTPDLAAARTFYADVAGLSIPTEPTPGPMDYRMISVPGGGFVGGAMQFEPAMLEHGAIPGWMGYLGVGDVDAKVDEVVAAGGKVHMPASDIDGVGRIALVADPQGAPFYLMRPTPPPGQEDAASTAFDAQAIGHVGWNELHARDQAEAMAFYAGHFGWEKSDALDMGPMGTYQMFKVGGTDQAVGAMMTSKDMPRPSWVYYFNVPDIDAAHAAATAGGGQVLHGPAEIPGGFYIVQATDPQGARFAVVGPRTWEA